MAAAPDVSPRAVSEATAVDANCMVPPSAPKLLWTLPSTSKGTVVVDKGVVDDVLVLGSTSAANPGMKLCGTSSLMLIEIVEVEVLPNPSVTVKLNTSLPVSMLVPLLASGVVSNGLVSV